MSPLNKTLTFRNAAIGYCCNSLGQYVSKFKTISLAACSKKQKEGVAKLRKVWRHNLNELAGILRYNMVSNIRLFRMSNNLFPLSDHSKFRSAWEQFIEKTDLSSTRKEIRRYLEFGGRITVHPGQFVSLGSPNKAIRKQSITHLDSQGRILDILGLPRTHFTPINIHLAGGREGRKNLQYFISSLEKVSNSVKKRLVFENEDKDFWTWQNISDCFDDFPITLDVHHHEINNMGESLTEAIEAARSTWGNILPVVHLSEGAKGPLDRAHHDWVSEIPPALLSNGQPLVDIELEAKKKDLALLWLKAKYRL